MLLQAMVLSGKVAESTFYDQVSGLPKPGYTVNLTVLDMDTDEKYECQLTEGFVRVPTDRGVSDLGAPEGVEAPGPAR